MDLENVLIAKRNLKTTTISSSLVLSLLRSGKDFFLILVFHISNMLALRTVYSGGDHKTLTGETPYLYFFGKFGSGETTTSSRTALRISTRLLRTFATRPLDTRGLTFS